MVILFDLDDTLLDHGSAERKAATALYHMQGRQEPIEDFLSAWHEALERHYARYLAGELTHQEQRRTRLRDVLGSNLGDEDADRLFDFYRVAYEEAWTLYEDVVPCLDALAQHRLGIVTNGDSAQQAKKLRSIVGRFEHVVASGECGWAKPSPEIFKAALARFAVSPEEACYVGDRYDIDAEAARRVGLIGIWLDRRSQATGEQLPPIITGLDQLGIHLGVSGAG